MAILGISRLVRIKFRLFSSESKKKIITFFIVGLCTVANATRVAISNSRKFGSVKNIVVNT